MTDGKEQEITAEDKPIETVPEDISAEFHISFEESTESIDLTKIVPSFEKKKRKVFDAEFFVRIFALMACAGILIYCIFAIADRVANDIDSMSIMNDLQNTAEAKSVISRIAPTKNSVATKNLYDSLGITEYETEWTDIDYTGEYDSIRYAIALLKSKNSDTFGWIRCSGALTNISYPIMKTDNNDTYISHNVYGEESESGAIFADCRNNTDMSLNLNTIFYGHCMTNGTMFRAIKDWYDSTTRNIAADSITIEIITFDAVYIYKLFASYRATGTRFTNVTFKNITAYADFLDEIQEKSVLNDYSKYDENSRIITLSTCTNSSSSKDERYVVHAILTKIIKYS